MVPAGCRSWGWRGTPELKDAPAVVTTLGHCALLKKLLASLLEGFADTVELRSTQGEDGSDNLVGIQGIAPSLMCIHTNILALNLRLGNHINQALQTGDV
jgi:hypothetical protein